MSFDNVIDRLKGALRRASDRLGGEAPLMKQDRLSPEEIEDRPLVAPLMDVFESTKEYMFRFDVPGATPKTTQVHCAEDGELTVYVKRAEGLGDPEASALWRKRETADWYRSVRLTFSADLSKTSSKLKDGVLTVVVPKRKAPEPRVVPVKTES